MTIAPQDNDQKVIPMPNINSENSDPYEIPMQDVFSVAASSIDEFDKNANEAGCGYVAPNFPMFSNNIEGLSNGFYIIAGYSNSGKTAFMTNLAYDLALNEKNHLYTIIYTLDDDKQSAISRILAMVKKIPIGVAAKPQRYKNAIKAGVQGASIYEEQLKKREEGLKELKDASNHFIVVGTEEIDCIEKLLNHAKMVKRYVTTRDPEANILVCIDSLMDINFDSENFREEKDKNARISKLVKRFAEVDLKCPIFGTAHVRKNSGKKVSISDLKESGRYEYDAKTVFIVSNDVSRNGQNATISYDNGDGYKHPILEIYWAKNKASSFKERTYCIFVPQYSYAKECDKEQTEYYDSLVYGD